MKHLKLAIAAVFVFVVSASAQSAKISADDIKIIEGTKWVGTLTYLDYNSNKKDLDQIERHHFPIRHR